MRGPATRRWTRSASGSRTTTWWAATGRRRTACRSTPAARSSGTDFKFNGLRELTDYLADNDEVRQCMVRFMSYFAYGADRLGRRRLHLRRHQRRGEGLELEHPQRADRHHARAALHHPGSVGGGRREAQPPNPGQERGRRPDPGAVLQPAAARPARAAAGTRQARCSSSTASRATPASGTRPASWASPASPCPTMLEALNEIKQHLVLVDGLSPKQPGDNHFSPHALTGVGREGRPDKGIISIEQFIGDQLEKTPDKRPDQDPAAGHRRRLRGGVLPEQRPPARPSPRRCRPTTPCSRAASPRRACRPASCSQQRKSILDVIKAGRQRARTACWAPARSRSWSCTSIRSASSRCASPTAVQSGAVACTKPAAPTDDLSSVAKKTLADMAHLDLIVNAFACDITRLGGGPVGQQPHLAVRHAHRPARRAAHGHHPRAARWPRRSRSRTGWPASSPR